MKTHCGFIISHLLRARISSPFLALQGRQPSTNLSTVLLDRTTKKGWHLHLSSGHAHLKAGDQPTWFSNKKNSSKRHSISKAPKLATCMARVTVISVTVFHLISNGSFLIFYPSFACDLQCCRRHVPLFWYLVFCLSSCPKQIPSGSTILSFRRHLWSDMPLGGQMYQLQTLQPTSGAGTGQDGGVETSKFFKRIGQPRELRRVMLVMLF